MKNKFGITLFLIFISFNLFSQTSNYKFHSVNGLSLINGVNEVSAGLQSVNGFQKGKWFAGLGVGLDYYLYRTIPVFGDIRYEFGKQKNKFFAYADGGVNVEWVEKYGNIYYIWDGPLAQNDGDFKNGIYTDVGLGYKIEMKRNKGIIVTLGHSHKSLNKTDRYQDWRTNEWLTNEYKYKLNRLVIKVGWEF